MRAETASRPVRGPRVDRVPSATFSATVSVSTSMKCWWIIPIPWWIALEGELIETRWPLIRISPSSGW